MSDLGNKQVMAQNIQYYLDLNHKDRNDLVKDLGLKYTTISNWLQAERYPRIDKIEMMANYFGVSKADLVERQPKAEKKELIPVWDDEDIRMLARKNFDDVSPEKANEKRSLLKKLMRIMFDEDNK